MTMKNKFLLFCIALLSISGITACKSSSSKNYFTYEDISFTDTYGNKTNSEAHNYNAIKVNPTEEELREDFAFGVDASMTKVVEECGGVYYNQDGKEQDLFQILRRNGVNFVRFRLWNNPQNKYGDKYGWCGCWPGWR